MDSVPFRVLSMSSLARSQYNYTKKMSAVCLSLLRSRVSVRVHGDVAVTPWRGLGRTPYLSLIFNACPLVSRPINNGVSINWRRAGVAGNLWRCQTAVGGAVTRRSRGRLISTSVNLIQSQS